MSSTRRDRRRRRAWCSAGWRCRPSCASRNIRSSTPGACQAEADRELNRITAIPGLAEGTPPPGFANFDQWLSGTELERELKIREYSVSNRGLRPGFVGTPEVIRERIGEFEAAGLDLLLLQMSLQEEEEMERFAARIIRR